MAKKKAPVKTSKPKRKPGNPKAAKFTNKLFDKICSKIATSSTGLQKACEENNVSAVAFYDWIKKSDKLLNKYTRAREDQADFLADEIIAISEHSEEDHTPFTGANVVNRDKLRIEARKWVAAKLKPKKYGDKIDVTTDGEKLPAAQTVIKWGEKEIKV